MRGLTVLLWSSVFVTGCFNPSTAESADGDATGSSGSAGDATPSTAGDAPSTGGPVGETEGPGGNDSTATGATSLNDGTTAGDSSGPGLDAEPPSLASTSPADGDLAVVAGTNIVLEFSEPMDESSTAAAYDSRDLPAADVTFSWNASSTVLTIDPNVDLEYATGTDPATTMARVYSFSLTEAATDVAGNPLANPTTIAFSTFRSIEQELVPVSDLTGRIRSNGDVDTFLWVSAGDTAVSGGNANDQMKGFITVDLAELPGGISSFELGNLRADQTQVNGTPYANLGGQVHLLQLSYDALGLEAFANPTTQNVGVFSSDATLETKEIDILEELQSAYDDGGGATNLLQFRLEFSTATDGAADLDTASFQKASVRLDVHYLIE